MNRPTSKFWFDFFSSVLFVGGLLLQNYERRNKMILIFEHNFFLFNSICTSSTSFLKTSSFKLLELFTGVLRYTSSALFESNFLSLRILFTGNTLH